MREEKVKVTYSNGRAKGGITYAYFRPSFDCSNKSRRCRVEDLDDQIFRCFPGPFIRYFIVDTYSVIGAKDEAAAVKEYYKICEEEKKGAEVTVEEITAASQEELKGKCAELTKELRQAYLQKFHPDLIAVLKS